MEAARKEIRDERLCMGQDVGRFVLTDFDLDPRLTIGPYVGFEVGEERRVIRKSQYGTGWIVQRYTHHPMGWLSDEEPVSRRETFAAALADVRAA